MYAWSLSAIDYHLQFREDEPWMASDATHTCIGLTMAETALSIPIPETPVYHAELLGLIIATILSPPPPGTTIYRDNRAALINIRKGRCPPAWVPLLTRLCASRAHSYRYVPTSSNPDDLPSRILCLNRVAQ